METFEIFLKVISQNIWIFMMFTLLGIGFYLTFGLKLITIIKIPSFVKDNLFDLLSFGVIFIINFFLYNCVNLALTTDLSIKEFLTISVWLISDKTLDKLYMVSSIKYSLKEDAWYLSEN